MTVLLEVNYVPQAALNAQRSRNLHHEMDSVCDHFLLYSPNLSVFPLRPEDWTASQGKSSLSSPIHTHQQELSQTNRDAFCRWQRAPFPCLPRCPLILTSFCLGQRLTADYHSHCPLTQTHGHQTNRLKLKLVASSCCLLFTTRWT